MKSPKTEKLGALLTESKIQTLTPNPERRIRVKLNVAGVEKRPLGNEIEGATKQFIRKSGQFIYGKQNFHKGAFGIVPPELDGFETSADIPSFDVRTDCLPEWIFYFFKIGDRYKELEKIARGIGSKRIHPDQISDIEIPLPPIEVQRNHVSKIGILECFFSDVFIEFNNQLNFLKKLRQQILQDAVQGKLVTQDPNDEPASVLLQKIKAEKERLIREKKIKKEKPLPAIKPEEIPFEIPENWVWCRLGDTGVFCRGKSKHRPRNDEKLFVNGQYPLVQTGDVSQSKKKNFLIDSYSSCYNELGLAQSRLWHKGTFCITIAANIAEVGFLSIDACVPDSVVTFSSIPEFQKKHLQYFFQITREEIEKFAPATAQKNINLEIIQSLLFPLPPVMEQTRIVAKVDQLMTLCDELEQTIKQNQTYSQQLLQVALKEALGPKI